MKTASFLILQLVLVLTPVFVSASEPAKISHFGQDRAAQTEVLPELFRLLVWNVQKFPSNQTILDFRQISQDAHIVLFQEAMDRADLTHNLSLAQPNLGWGLARSFMSGRGYTGVATGSSVRPQTEAGFLSPVVEPVANTAKTTMVTTYKLHDSEQPLKVINVHAINFVSTYAFEKHIKQIVALAESHQGPLIIAGDFNTWSEGRFDVLFREMEKLGLKRLPLQDDRWIKTFDHIFIRGLRLEQSVDLSKIRSSDHEPLMVDLVYDPHGQTYVLQ